jgi:hypothetical protein
MPVDLPATPPLRPSRRRTLRDTRCIGRVRFETRTGRRHAGRIRQDVYSAGDVRGGPARASRPAPRSSGQRSPSRRWRRGRRAEGPGRGPSRPRCREGVVAAEAIDHCQPASGHRAAGGYWTAGHCPEGQLRGSPPPGDTTLLLVARPVIARRSGRRAPRSALTLRDRRMVKRRAVKGSSPASSPAAPARRRAPSLSSARVAR